MPTTATAELYFIAGAFVLIIAICVVSVYVFIRQYKREKGKQEEPEVRASANHFEEEE
jgi:hypothetical protein